MTSFRKDREICKVESCSGYGQLEVRSFLDEILIQYFKKNYYV